MYDFKTGEKLYSPKLSDNRLHNFASAHSPMGNKNISSIQPFKAYDQHG